jgi:HK97 family phage major capsid protein
MSRELKVKRAGLIEEMRRILDEAEKEERGLTGEEKEKIEKIEREIEEIDELIAKKEEMRAKMEVVVETREVVTDAVRAFEGYLREGSLSDFEKRALTESSTGGYFVPTELLKTYYEALTENSIMRRICRVIQTSTNTAIPVVTAHGSPQWVAEGGTVSDSDPAINQVTLSAHKLAYILKVSEELASDSAIDINQFVLKEFGRIFGVAEDAAFIAGDGSGKPQGVVTAAETGKQTVSTSAITTDELIDLYYSLDSPYRANAVFIAHPTTVAAIRKLKNSDGDYVWQPGLTSGEPDRLLGCPIYTSSAVPQIAPGNKVVVFFDPNYYVIADRGGLSIAVLKELYAGNGYIGYRGTLRVDGKLVLSDAAKALVMKSS